MPQSLALVYIHAVFSTKNREPILAESWREELHACIGGEINHLGCQSLIVGGIADHVHALFQLARTTSLADAIGRIKVASSAWITKERKVPGRFAWQSGYSAFSVSRSNVEQVRAYIQRQEEHHATTRFQDEYRRLLEAHGIVYDEQYVWD